MSSTTYATGSVIASTWLNEVNNTVYNLYPTTAANLTSLTGTVTTLTGTVNNVIGTVNVNSNAITALNDTVAGHTTTLGTLAPKVSPVLTTPSLGVATATSINGNQFQANGSCIWSMAAGKTFTVNNTLSLAGPDGAGLTLGSGSHSLTGSFSGSFSGTFSGTHSGASSGTNTGDQVTFANFAVSGQPTITAKNAVDTMNFTAGTGVTLATNAVNNTLTISMAGTDTSNGFVGMTGFNHNFFNTSGAYKSLLTNGATAARTYTFPDKDITVAGTTNETLIKPTIRGYIEQFQRLNSGSAITLDPNGGTVMQVVITASTTITLPPASPGVSYTLITYYNGAYSLTFTGGTSLRWAGGTAPVSTSVGGRLDKYQFTCGDDYTLAQDGGRNF